MFINKAYKEAINLSKIENIHEVTDYGIFPKDIAGKVVLNDKKVIEENRLIFFKEEVPHPDGSTKNYMSYKFPIRNSDGELTSVTGFSIDISEQVRLEKELMLERSKLIQASKLASLGKLAAGVSHEINNPLTIISGCVQIILRSLDDIKKVKLNARNIKQSVDRISAIVKGVKKFSRTSESQFKKVDLNSLVLECLKLTALKTSKYHFKVEYMEVKNCFLNCDEIQIEQVLVNLLTNSIDEIANNESPWVKVILKDYQDCFEISVQDSGIGISDNVKEKMFDPFFTTKEIGKGTGLGLSISTGIVSDHGGELYYEIRDGHTSFNIRLPKS